MNPIQATLAISSHSIAGGDSTRLETAGAGEHRAGLAACQGEDFWTRRCRGAVGREADAAGVAYQGAGNQAALGGFSCSPFASWAQVPIPTVVAHPKHVVLSAIDARAETGEAVRCNALGKPLTCRNQVLVASVKPCVWLPTVMRPSHHSASSESCNSPNTESVTERGQSAVGSRNIFLKKESMGCGRTA